MFSFQPELAFYPPASLHFHRVIRVVQPHEKRDRERETQDQAIGLKFYGAYLWLQTNQSCRALLFYGPQFISWLLKDLPHPCPTLLL